ncbi:putative plus-end-directed kinesin ATPase [Helianthus debilis subsp. tardiflorus]
MLRDFKIMRRNSGKSPNLDEPENVPVNVKFHEASVSNVSSDSSSRPPLNTIQELGFKVGKIDRTPTKVDGGRVLESGMSMRTPEKGLGRSRYGWGSESRNEGRIGNVNVNTPRSCRTIGRAVSSGYSEGNSTQNTPTKSVNKPPNPGLLHGGSLKPPAGGSVRSYGNIAALSRGSPSTHTTVNTVEVPHFELKEDPSFWMDHNVQVLIRIRPLNNMELSTHGYNRCLKQESAQSVTFVAHPETRFTFDHVACETIDQETLFRMAGLPMVENCLSGYNSCIFAYGQTGSGKTHTMLGEINELEVKPSPYRGMTPRMFEFLFARIIAEEESRVDERLTYNCKCSFLEIYNEQITDLLDPSSTNLHLREDVKKGVYVENLTEFEVHTVGDILRLLSRGSANRRVAATNMNRESSRSHCVFTCVIESRWEKDSTSNLRFARLNLVDLAGSERQKTSGAEGERLKEAANINKSLSTLGHVIMALVDGANARTRHIPYRDSRLTFLLQDSLGGNSKTMIIANVSPSICSATETLNTLKFAQRAKLIQNNAVVNEDASGDVMALQHQIQLLKEELAILKRQNVSRSLTFGPKVNEETIQEHENDFDNTLGHDNKTLRVSSKQLKSLEASLTGALRREQMSESAIKQLEAEIEQLNRLVRQREEDNKCTKMMLKFREDKIQRMESVVAGSIPADSYLLEENNMLTEEIQMLRAKVDKNPEVTRFALENIRLLEQLRRLQDFCEEGEREMLLNEVSELRNQLVLALDENSKQDGHAQKEAAHDAKENTSLRLELERSQEELEKCKNNLNSCLEQNAKLFREIEDLNALLEHKKSAVHEHDDGIEVIKEPILEASSIGKRSMHTFQNTHQTHVEHSDDVMDMQLDESIQLSRTLVKNDEAPVRYIEEAINLQMQVDILEMILKEESSTRAEIEEKYKDLKDELEEAKSVIEALETQQLISINELEDLRNRNNRFSQDLHLPPSSNDTERVQEKMNRMQDSLEKARRTNKWYKTERECNAVNEEEMDEVRKQVEAETAEVIVCLQEEISSLQEQLLDRNTKEMELKQELTVVQAKLTAITECNEALKENYEEKERELNVLTNEIQEVLTAGHDTLEDALNDLDDVTVCEQLQIITKNILEKDSRIKELNLCLEDAKNKGTEMEGMLRSLKGATLVMSEAHQQDCSEKDQVIRQLSSRLSEKSCVINELSNTVKEREQQIKKISDCAAGAFVVVNWFSEIKDGLNKTLMQKDAELEELKLCDKDQVIRQLSSRLSEKSCVINELSNTVKEREQQIKKISDCAAGAFVVVNWFSEIKDGLNKTLMQKDAELEELKKNHIVQSCRSSRDVCRRDDTIVLLKKELETALESLKGVKAEMARLRSERDVIRLSEKQSRQSIEGFVPQVLALQATLDNFEKQTEVAMVSLDNKIQTVEGLLQKSCKSCHQKKKLYEHELMDAKVNAAQQAAESSCVYAKFAEAQYTIKEADVMINELLIANETMKLEIESLKKKEVTLINERDTIMQQFETDTMGMKKEIEELEGMIVQTRSIVDQDLIPIASDFFCVKSRIQDSSKLIQSWIEDIWSEIIAKDCVVSVLRVCHMGILLEMVTGLNAENGLLHHGLCESSSLVSQLREHNCKSRNELEMCREIQAKLLADIKNSFDRVSKGTQETDILSVKLASFEEKIVNLQAQEEAMVERSKYMGSELSDLVKELDAVGKDEEVRFLEETFMVDLLEKEIELVVLSEKLKEEDSQRKDLEKANKNMSTIFVKFKEDKEEEVDFLSKKTKGIESQILEKSQTFKEELEVKDMELRNMRLHVKDMNAALQQREAFNNLTVKECVNLMSSMDKETNRVFSLLSERIVSLEQRLEEINGSTEKTSTYIEELQSLEDNAKVLISENVLLQSEMNRKEEVLEGLKASLEILEDELRLLKEFSSNKQDQKDETEELKASLELLKNELNEKVAVIAMLEADVSREGDLVKSLFSEIEKLTESVKDALKAKETCEAELVEAKLANESLEMELVQLESDLSEINKLAESRTIDLRSVSCKRDDLHAELLEVRKELEMAQAIAEENEAIATEAKQMAETSRLHVEEKDEEVKLYEKSVEELEFIVNALENQVEMVKGEAERQRLQREELEVEFQAFKQQIHTVHSNDSDVKRILNEKEKSLQEVLQRVQILEKEIASKDSEILQHKAHINELNLHAEAQAREYKQTFKTLEAMADQVKSDSSAPLISNSPSKKLEKNASRARGSGSPFKCIGIGLAQQMKSEKDEELAAAKRKIEELEALAASRQKEIFALNAKLAMSGSMTHDVLRDLLGIKLDMTTYSSLVNGHQNEEINEKAQVHNAEVQYKEEEVVKLKKQLNELVNERQGWLEEIERKQGEMIAAQVALEQLRQRDRLLSTENEMFKTEIGNHKKKVMELETEVTKLSGQQNLQQRIHHHTKIKEENNALKAQNEELSRKLKRSDVILSRVKEELANLRAAHGKNAYYVETELQLVENLKETEEERDHLAQKLAALCTSILKATGVNGPTSDVNVTKAEEALEQFQRRVAALERELQDLQYKNRICNERARLSELMPQTAKENNRSSPFLSTLDR